MPGPPTSRFNGHSARVEAVRIVRDSTVPIANLSAPAQVVNPTDAGYSISAVTQATEPVQLPIRQPFNLIYGPRPIGTAGRDDFCLRQILGLNAYEYLHCIKTMRNVSFSCGIDVTMAILYQNRHKLTLAYNMFLEELPEFKAFDDRYWAPEAFMYKTLKSSSQSWRQNNPDLAAARASARAVEQAAIKAAAIAKKVKRPRGRPKGKGKAKQVVVPKPIVISPPTIDVPPAVEGQLTVEGLDDIDEVVGHLSHMSLEPDIAVGFESIMVDQGAADDDDDNINPGQPLFGPGSNFMGGISATRLDISSGAHAMSTPHVPPRLVARDIDSFTATGNYTGGSNTGSGYAPALGQVSSHIYMLPATAEVIPGTNGYAMSQLNKMDGTTSVTGAPNHPSCTITAPSSVLGTPVAHVPDSSHTYNGSLHPPPIPCSSRPPPIPHSSRPLSAYFNSFSSSLPPDSSVLPSPVNSRGPSLSPNTSYGIIQGNQHTDSTASHIQGFGYARVTTAPESTIYQDLPRSPLHSQAPAYTRQEAPINHASSDLPSRTALTHSNSHHSLNFSYTDAARLVVVDIAPQTQTNHHAPSLPRAPASILALAGDTLTDGSNTHPLPQPSKRSTAMNIQDSLPAFDDEVLSDAPSATESNNPVKSDTEPIATVRATTNRKTTSRAKKGTKQAQLVLDDKEHPDDPETGTQVKGRGRGARGGHGSRGGRSGRGRGHGEQHDENNGRGRGGRGGRARGGRARGGTRTQAESGADIDAE